MRSTTAADLKGRCARCFVLSSHCVCASIPNVPTSARFLIIRHAKEAWRSTNTGRLAALALPNSQVIALGQKGTPLDAAALDEPDTWLLFPGSDEPALFPRPPRRVVVLDGSWSQALRMAHRIEALRRMPRLSLGAPPAGTHRLRRPTVPNGMSTLEAIASAVSLLDGDARAGPLRALHQTFVEQTLKARGKA